MNTIDIIEQDIFDRSPELLNILLEDKSTKKYVKWATDTYHSYGSSYRKELEIFPKLIIEKRKTVIQPRVAKSLKEQSLRTREKAEVFTPSWVCNQQNNLIDSAWFGRKDVFNYEMNNQWITNPEKVMFPNEKTWKEYIDCRRLEISCGEAPYLASRYDTVSGDYIPVKERIGLLDRKLRIVSENTVDENEWYEWTIRAFQSIYGYDYQGDNVLLARENLLYTFEDYMEEKFNHKPSLNQLRKIANIIAWNIWQMDGLTYTAPFSESAPEFTQLSLFDTEEPQKELVKCQIYNWRSNIKEEFCSMIKGD